MAGVALGPARIAGLIAPPATVGPAGEADATGSAEQLYLIELNPYLGVVVGEGNRLVELGRSRSRNVLELGVRMDRFREASATVRAYIATNPPPPALKWFADGLTAELASAESAIESSTTAIRGFDWDALGTSVEDFARSVDAIEALSGRKNQR